MSNFLSTGWQHCNWTDIGQTLDIKIGHLLVKNGPCPTAHGPPITHSRTDEYEIWTIIGLRIEILLICSEGQILDMDMSWTNLGLILEFFGYQ